MRRANCFQNQGHAAAGAAVAAGRKNGRVRADDGVSASRPCQFDGAGAAIGRTQGARGGQRVCESDPFGPNEDFAKYPRDAKGDQRLCRAAGVDVFFAPDDGEMYPADFSTAVQEEKLAGGMEGAARPGHFRGVTTVVAKLFNAVLPTAAVFGAKDFQQASVIGRMTRDLNFPVKIVVGPTVREGDGVAISSRINIFRPRNGNRPRCCGG